MLWENDYLKQYENKTILIKVSGSQIVGEKSQKLIWDIKELLFANINIILVFGGGQQIDQEWKKHSSEERKKINGVGVTSLEVLEYGVDPAYSDIINQLKSIFKDYLYNIISSENVVCETNTQLGLVGKVSQIKWIDSSKQLNIVWFMGEDTWQKLNVNADEIAQKIIFQQGKDLSNVVFVSSLSGLLDKKWEHVPLVVNTRIQDILDNKDEDIEAKDGMIKKLKETSIILEHTNKVVFLDSNSLLDEITTWEWKGTLFLNIDDVKLDTIKDSYKNFIKNIYLDYTSNQEIWNNYTLEEIIDNHYVLQVNDSILWGVSIIQTDNKVDIEFVWSSQNKWKFVDKIYKLANIEKNKILNNQFKTGFSQKC